MKQLEKTFVVALAALLAMQSGAAVPSAAAVEASLAKGARVLLDRQAEEGFWSDRQMPALTALPEKSTDFSSGRRSSTASSGAVVS